MVCDSQSSCAIPSIITLYSYLASYSTHRLRNSLYVATALCKQSNMCVSNPLVMTVIMYNTEMHCYSSYHIAQNSDREKF